MEEAFEDPHNFIPERWYSKPELVKDKRAHAPFSLGKQRGRCRDILETKLTVSLGRYTCSGKRIAQAQLRLTLAVLLTKYKISFPPGIDEMSAEKEMEDQLTPLPGDLELVFEELKV